MSTKPINSNSIASELKTQKTKTFNHTKKTNNKAIKTIKPLTELQLATPKRDYNDAFTPDVSSENKRISQIAFPSSPNSSPTQFSQKRPIARFQLTPAPLLLNVYVEQEAQVETCNDNISSHYLNISVKQEAQVETCNNNISSADKIIIEETIPMPRAPVKKPRAGSTLTVFQKQHEALSNGTFKYKVTYLAKGTYSKVYTLEKNEESIIPEINNADLVLKAYHGEKSGFGELKLRAFLQNAIENYRAAMDAGLPVAEIHNAGTAVQDGYIIQQKISQKIDPLNADQRTQVRRFFDYSVNKRIIFDLQAQNFALENGQVILVDFIEDPDDDDELDAFNKKVLENWLNIYKKEGIGKDQIAIFLNELSADHYQEFILEKIVLI